MPYIDKDARRKLRQGAVNLGLNCDSPGELNYIFTVIMLKYLGSNPNYQKFNDLLGALEGAKLELYRQFIAPYEDEKIELNGKVT